jgi:hypothetical protein
MSQIAACFWEGQSADQGGFRFKARLACADSYNEDSAAGGLMVSLGSKKWVFTFYRNIPGGSIEVLFVAIADISLCPSSSTSFTTVYTGSLMTGSPSVSLTSSDCTDCGAACTDDLLDMYGLDLGSGTYSSGDTSYIWDEQSLTLSGSPCSWFSGVTIRREIGGESSGDVSGSTVTLQQISQTFGGSTSTVWTLVLNIPGAGTFTIGTLCQAGPVGTFSDGSIVSD